MTFNINIKVIKEEQKSTNSGSLGFFLFGGGGCIWSGLAHSNYLWSFWSPLAKQGDWSLLTCASDFLQITVFVSIRRINNRSCLPMLIYHFSKTFSLHLINTSMFDMFKTIWIIDEWSYSTVKQTSDEQYAYDIFVYY